MGQKTNPIGFRLGVNRPWNSRWYASDRDFADLVYEDMMIKRYINRRLENAGISGVMISRAPKKVTVDIKTARPGIVIGRRGAEVDKLREELQMLTGKDIALNIVEVRKPELDARLVADSIARQLEGRVSFRRAMKKAVAATMKMGADGIKVQCGGRLGGAEIARTEKYKDGRVPLHTLRADIDYSTATAATTYGCIGVKVWICRGEILGRGPLGGDEEKEEMITPDASPATRPRRGKAARGQKRRPRGRVRRPESKPNRGEGEARPRGRRPEGPASKPASERSRGGPKDTTQQRPPKPKGGPKGTTQQKPAPPKPKRGPKSTTQNKPAPAEPPDKSGENKKPDAQE